MVRGTTQPEAIGGVAARAGRTRIRAVRRRFPRAPVRVDARRLLPLRQVRLSSASAAPVPSPLVHSDEICSALSIVIRERVPYETRTEIVTCLPLDEVLASARD